MEKIDEEKLALHVSRIKRALEKNGIHAEEEEIRRKFMDVWVGYGLSASRAEANVLDEYGVIVEEAPASGEVKLNALVPEEWVNVRGKIVSINRAVMLRDGKETIRYYGILRDDTGSAPFTAWNTSALEGMEKWDDIKIEGAIVEEWNGTLQIKIVRTTKVSRTELDFEVPLSGAGAARGPSESVSLRDIRPGNRIAFKARVLSVEDRKITAKGEEKTIYSGLLSDGSAKVSFTAWKDFGLEAGDVIKVDGAYVREWRGSPQINLDEGMEVEKVSDDFPSMDELDRATPVRLWELDGSGFPTSDVQVDATIIQVKQGSGLIFRCPECRWVLQDGVCKKHGKVEGVPDLRIKAVIDDGTGALNIVAGREITAKILGKSVEDCVKQARDEMDRSVIYRELEEKILARNALVRGNVLQDDSSKTLIVTDMQLLQKDAVEEAEKLIEEWGV